MSFDIEFVHANGNTDQPEVTANSSLTYLTTVREPSSGEYFTVNVYEYRFHYDNTEWEIVWNGSVIGTTNDNVSFTSGIWTYYKGAFFDNTQGGTYSSWYIYRISNSAPASVSITPSTLQQGAPMIGGSAVGETIVTTQDGVGAAASAASEFGLVIKNGSTPIFEVRYLPPALAAESASVDAMKQKVFTATSADLTVESFGLGDGQQIEQGSTVIIE